MVMVVVLYKGVGGKAKMKGAASDEKNHVEGEQRATRRRAISRMFVAKSLRLLPA